MPPRAHYRRAHVTASTFLNQVDLGSIPFPEGPPSAWSHGPWSVLGGCRGCYIKSWVRDPYLRDAIPYVAREQLARDHTLLFSTWRPSPVQLHCRLGPHFLGRAGCGQLNSEQELTLSYQHAVYYSLPFVNARQAEPAPQQRHARSKGGGGNLGETIRIKLYITG